MQNVDPVEKSSPDLAQIFEPIRSELELVDREFERHLQSHVDLIPKIGQYIRTSGGKRIRPAVLLISRTFQIASTLRPKPDSPQFASTGSIGKSTSE